MPIWEDPKVLNEWPIYGRVLELLTTVDGPFTRSPAVTTPVSGAAAAGTEPMATMTVSRSTRRWPLPGTGSTTAGWKRAPSVSCTRNKPDGRPSCA